MCGRFINLYIKINVCPASVHPIAIKFWRIIVCTLAKVSALIDENRDGNENEHKVWS